MRRPGADRDETTCDFVLSLGTCVESFQPQRQAEVDGSVVAQLKMEVVRVGRAAPVTTVERIVSDQPERAGQILFAASGHNQKRRAWKSVVKLKKETLCQARLAPLAMKRRAIEAVKDRPVLLSDGITDECFNRQILLSHEASFPFDLLALL